MVKDVNGNPNLGLCQKILDRISEFLMDSKIYEDVDSINLTYLGVEGLRFDVPRSTITYAGLDIYQWEFPTLYRIKDYCQIHSEDNVLYLHTQGVSQGFKHPKIEMLNERRDYFVLEHNKIQRSVKVFENV